MLSSELLFARRAQLPEFPFHALLDSPGAGNEFPAKPHGVRPACARLLAMGGGMGNGRNSDYGKNDKDRFHANFSGTAFYEALFLNKPIAIKARIARE